MKVFKVIILVLLFPILFYYFYFIQSPFLLNNFEVESLKVKVNIYEILIIGVLLAPIFETVIFITLPFYLWLNKSYKWFENLHLILLVFYSAVLFSLTHSYSLNYIIVSFFSGLYFFCVFLIIYFISNGIKIFNLSNFFIQKLGIINHKVDNILIATIYISMIHFCNNSYAFYNDFIR